MFGGWLRNRVDQHSLAAFHFRREPLYRSFEGALARGQHVLLYGLPRQGKSTLVRRGLDGRESITIRASSDITFADIARSYLLSLGCSLTVEHKRKKKLSGKAEVKFQWPLASATGSVEAGHEGEVTLRSITAEIGNPNDVAYLIREIGRAPCLVVDGFGELGDKQRRRLFEFMKMASEGRLLQVVLIDTSSEFPLDYRERFEVSRFIEVIRVPPLSWEETQAFVAAALDALRCPRNPDAARLIHDVFAGSVETTLDACEVVAGRLAARAEMGGAEQLRAAVFEAIHERTQSHFLMLLAVIIDEGWSVTVARTPESDGPAIAALAATDQVPTPDPIDATEEGEEDEEWPSEDDDEPALAPGLALDPVYGRLRDVLHWAATEGVAAVRPVGLQAFHREAIGLGRRLLALVEQTEGTRRLAHGLADALDTRPRVLQPYLPLHHQSTEQVSLGHVICDLLLGADPGQRLVLDAGTLKSLLAARQLELVEPQYGEKDPMRSLSNKVRRLQRRLRVDPPLLGVDADRTQIVLWEPRHRDVFGDIKPGLRKLLEALEQED